MMTIDTDRHELDPALLADIAAGLLHRRPSIGSRPARRDVGRI
jgi:hypothetical protein